MSTIHIFQFTDPAIDDRPDFPEIPKEIQKELDELFAYLYPETNTDDDREQNY